MTRVLFLHAHHRHAVGAAFRRQVEIDDFRKLLLQNRHKDFVQRHTENGRLIRRAAGVGTVVNRVFAVGNALDGKYRELIDLVVIAGVVTEWPLWCHLARMNHSFEYDFSRGRYQQVVADTFYQLGLAVAQQAGKSVFAQGVRHGGDGTENGGRVGTQRDSYRERFARMGLLPLKKIQRAAAMAEPAHNHLVFSDHLLTINT